MPSYVLVWFLFVFAWMANYLVRIGFAALLPPIMRDLDLSYTRAGMLASAFFVAYGIVQLPAGLLGDRGERRRVLIGGLLAGALASLSTAFGLYNTVCVVGAVISPGLTGWTRDVTGSFVAGAYLCAVVAVVGALITLPIRSRTPVST